MITRVTLATILALLTAVPALPQERFSFFQASTPESVERMLKLADLRDDDVVVDLGSGNGLIPLTAARMNRAAAGPASTSTRSSSTNPTSRPAARGSGTASASSTATRSTPTFARRPS